MKLMNLMNLILVYSIIFVRSITVTPNWITNSYVQANSQKNIDGDICNCTTGNTQTPTATMTFVTAFTLIPHLGYGISNYQGK
jgi:hypothetical protein